MKTSWRLILAGAALLVLTACGQAPPPPGRPTPPAANEENPRQEVSPDLARHHIRPHPARYWEKTQ